MGDNISSATATACARPCSGAPDRNARVLPRRSASAVPAAHHGPGVRLSVHQRRGAAARSVFAFELDAAPDRDAQDHRAFGRGGRDSCVRATARSWPMCANTGDETILCVANLSRSPQPVELDLAAFKGRVPVEMMGRSRFRPSARCPTSSRSAAHGFYGSTDHRCRAAVLARAAQPLEERPVRACCSTVGRACSAIAWSPGGSAWRRTLAAVRVRDPAALYGDAALVCRQGRLHRTRTHSPTTSLWEKRGISAGCITILEVGHGPERAEPTGYFVPLALAWEAVPATRR